MHVHINQNINKKVVFLGAIGVFWLAYLGSIVPIIQGDIALDTFCNISTGIYREFVWDNGVIQNNQTFICPAGYGCSYNQLECNAPANPQIFFAFAIVFSSIFIFFGAMTIAARKIDWMHWSLELMFFIFSIIYLIVDIWIITGFATLTMNSLRDLMVTVYGIGVWTFVLFIFYIFILVFKGLIDGILDKKKAGKPVKL